ncbi:hypothetical protein CEXT_139981 [Caerostris extrusa]|uniref:Uncharacterized protein n=1 Tax=Caerostris extrusa TaxID=172846 RepID=A0AAV4TIH2_CAEEX|nr:hypothetical protein CEXT_139981 [Caerostris extrusa]
MLEIALSAAPGVGVFQKKKKKGKKMVLWINNNGEKIALEGRGEEKNSHYLLLARPLLSGYSSCFLISLSSPGVMVEDTSAGSVLGVCAWNMVHYIRPLQQDTSVMKNQVQYDYDNQFCHEHYGNNHGL